MDCWECRFSSGIPVYLLKGIVYPLTWKTVPSTLDCRLNQDPPLGRIWKAMRVSLLYPPLGWPLIFPGLTTNEQWPQESGPFNTVKGCFKSSFQVTKKFLGGPKPGICLLMVAIFSSHLQTMGFSNCIFKTWSKSIKAIVPESFTPKLNQVGYNREAGFLF